MRDLDILEDLLGWCIDDEVHQCQSPAIVFPDDLCDDRSSTGDDSILGRRVHSDPDEQESIVLERNMGFM